ncbi:hypothetical protein LCGC14_1737950 [marine sediment metagenome]|uniref:Uncharacterized protein n=1 Tax=marine sediment metagenome TaxID=412755 RepID=A0A0F9JMV6_9ZZZZ
MDIIGIPIWFIAWMLIAFGWLGYETDWLTVNITYGYAAEPKYAKWEVYHMLKNRQPNWRAKPAYEGSNLPVDYKPNGEPCYRIILSPGIKNVLCGFAWLNKHCADMVDYQPEVSMNIGGVRYSMTIKEPAIIKDVMRANKLTRSQRLSYA